MKESLFIVESPFQLLQVVELVVSGNQPYQVIIRLNRSEQNNKQLVKICEKFQLNSVEFARAEGVIGRLIYMFKVWKYIIRAKHVYIGDIDSYTFRYFKHRLEKKNVTLLDDGVATISQTESTQDFNRFSIFPNYKGQVTNTFPSIRHYINEHITSGSGSLIIGGKLVEEGICSISSYHRFLDKCLSKNSDLIYIPHRGESEENLSLIKEKYGLQVIRLDLPIELAAIELNIIPKNIFSCFSTALISMPVIYPESSFYCYEFERDEILKRKEHITKVYKYLDEQKRLIKM